MPAHKCMQCKEQMTEISNLCRAMISLGSHGCGDTARVAEALQWMDRGSLGKSAIPGAKKRSKQFGSNSCRVSKAELQPGEHAERWMISL